MSKSSKRIGAKLLNFLRDFSPRDLRDLKVFITQRVSYLEEDKKDMILVVADVFFRHIKDQQENDATDLPLAELEDALKENGLYAYRNLISRRINSITEYALDFLVANDFKHKKQRRLMVVLRQLNRKDLRSLFKTYWNKTSKIIEAEDHDDNNLLDRYLLEEELVFYLSNGGERSLNNHQSQAITYLEHFYHARKLKLLVVQLNQSKILNTEFDEKGVAEFIKSCEDYKDSVLIIRMYLLIYRLFQTELESYYKDFMEELEGNKNRLSLEELKDLYVLALNFRLRIYHKTGDKAAYKKYFELFKMGIESGILLDPKDEKGRYMSTTIFKNGVKLGIHFQELEWTSGFIKKNKPLLRAEDQPIATTFVEGLLAFERGEYDVVRKKMNFVIDNTRDFYYQVDARTNKLKALYHLDQGVEDFVIDIDSFQPAARMYFGRNKNIAERRKRRFENFISYYGKLRNARYNNLKHLETLIKETENQKELLEKEWLLEVCRLRLNSLKK